MQKFNIKDFHHVLFYEKTIFFSVSSQKVIKYAKALLSRYLVPSIWIFVSDLLQNTYDTLTISSSLLPVPTYRSKMKTFYI